MNNEGKIIRAVPLSEVYSFTSTVKIIEPLVLKDFVLYSYEFNLKSPTGYLFKYRRRNSECFIFSSED